MKKLVLLTTFFTIISCLSSNNNEVKTDPKFMEEYSGGYTVKVNGQSSEKKVEVYALNENGGASWL